MKKYNEYYERQSQKPWWLWALMIGLNLLMIYGVVRQLIFEKQFGTNPMSDTGLIIVASILFIVSFVLMFSRLDTVINKEGIFVRYFPFNLRHKFWSWDDINAISIRSYQSMKEFGGTGIRQGRGIKAYIVSGNQGLQFELHNGNKILIGTRYPEDINEVLRVLGK